MSQTPDSPSLSEAQLATLAEIGEERTANAGDVLYRVGDRTTGLTASRLEGTPERMVAEER